MINGCARSLMKLKALLHFYLFFQLKIKMKVQGLHGSLKCLTVGILTGIKSEALQKHKQARTLINS